MKKLLSLIIFSVGMLILNNVFAQPLYVEQFDLSATPISFGGTAAASISTTRIGSYGACGEVKIINTSPFSSGYQAVSYTFPVPIVINSASDAVIKIRLRTASATPFRLAFRGNAGTGNTNLSCVWAAKEVSFTGNINTWQELSFNYSTAGDLNISGCSATALTFPGAIVTGIAININTASTTFPNPIYIDYISVGATSPSAGTTCQTDYDAAPANPLFVQQFDPSEANQTAVTGTEITSTNVTVARAAESAGATCGQLDVRNAAGSLTGNYSTINYDTALTLANSNLAVIRVRAKVTNGTAVPVRAIFRGDVGTGIVNLSNVWLREQKSLPGDGNWHELVFYYGFTGDLNSSGGAGTALTFPANIDGIGIAFYTGATAVSNTISVDYIAVGNTPGTPTVNAGVDQTLCPNSGSVTLNGSVTVATGGTWSGGSGNFSPNANTLNATYTPSAAEITAGTVTLTLTPTGAGTCNVATDQMVITICTTTGLSKSSLASSIEIYPVPAEDILHITTNGILNNAKVILMNTLGSLLKEEEMINGELSINISSLESGLYLVGIYNENELVKIEKIIIK